MGKIVAIGGGEMAERETLAIDEEIVALTGKDSPKALFIPTASRDSPKYWQSFQEVYGQELGCGTDVLYLLDVSPTIMDLEQKILSVDLVYVGGGVALKMMRRWRKLGGGQSLARGLQERRCPVRSERGMSMLVQLGS